MPMTLGGMGGLQCVTDTADVWALVADERRSLAEDLAGLSAAQWATPSLCGEWNVEETLAHLTAAASIGPWRWVRSVVGARFDFDRHNARRLRERMGPDPAGTLARFREVQNSKTAPMGEAAAWLGEVVVHAQDIRQPLGLRTRPSEAATMEVARFFARRDFTVKGRTLSRGLRLRATDGPFVSGDGPEVKGPALALVVAMAGRPAYLDELEGPGLEVIRSRVAQS
jgi:uncharacterized protein (TIGR03083 family)